MKAWRHPWLLLLAIPLAMVVIVGLGGSLFLATSTGAVHRVVPNHTLPVEDPVTPDNPLATNVAPPVATKAPGPNDPFIPPAGQECVNIETASQTHFNDTGKKGPYAFHAPVDPKLGLYALTKAIYEAFCGQYTSSGARVHGADQRYWATWANLLYRVNPNDRTTSTAWWHGHNDPVYHEIGVNNLVGSRIRWDLSTLAPFTPNADTVTYEMVGLPGNEFPLVHRVPPSVRTTQLFVWLTVQKGYRLYHIPVNPACLQPYPQLQDLAPGAVQYANLAA